MPVHRRALAAAVACSTALAAVLVPASAASGATRSAPGGPGTKATAAPADSHGFGTSRTLSSKVWFTLEKGGLGEVYYPDLGTPALRGVELLVTDGKSFVEREQDATVQTTRQVSDKGLTYQQVNTERSHRWRVTKTYVTDPRTSTVTIDIRFQSLTGRPYSVFVYDDPSLSNTGDDDLGRTAGGALLSHDATSASALIAEPALTRTSTGFLGTSDGWTDLKNNKRMDWTYTSSGNGLHGNVVQTGMTTLNGTTSKSLVVAVGFGRSEGAALTSAKRTVATGFSGVAATYAAGWAEYLRSLKTPPHLATARERATYTSSVMVLAAAEDKTYRGAFVASPTMPWVWGSGLETPTGAYHLVWSRDLYEIATGLIADGDLAGANRALDFLFNRQQKPDGSFPQNSTVTGKPDGSNLQLDEVADPILLAWQLGRYQKVDWTHVRAAADFLVGYVDPKTGLHSPWTQQERWENQGGYSPATIASEIAALVTAADIAHINGDEVRSTTYLATADSWQKQVKAWTATTTGPYSSQAYFLRLTKDGKPDVGTTYDIGDSGPAGVDQRTVVDPSFLELVRLGVLPANDPVVLNTIAVVDTQLGVSTPSGMFWHRYSFDGYGEQRNGSDWAIGLPPGSQQTIGRVWPIFAGERGEYDLLAGTSAAGSLDAMAESGNDGLLLPEQVWDTNAPAGADGPTPGTPTRSATPLLWSHAQFVRLAWSISAGYPVEQPRVVACRYTTC